MEVAHLSTSASTKTAKITVSPHSTVMAIRRMETIAGAINLGKSIRISATQQGISRELTAMKMDSKVSVAYKREANHQPDDKEEACHFLGSSKRNLSKSPNLQGILELDQTQMRSRKFLVTNPIKMLVHASKEAASVGLASYLKKKEKVASRVPQSFHRTNLKRIKVVLTRSQMQVASRIRKMKMEMIRQNFQIISTKISI